MTLHLPPFVQQLLDRGEDPLADPRTQQWLLDTPDALESFAALRRTLVDLRTLAPPQPAMPRQPARRWPWLLATAAAVAAVATGVLLWRPPTPPPTGPLPRPDLAAGSGVVFCRVATTWRAGTRGRQEVLEYSRPRTGDGSAVGVDRRSRRTLSTRIDLPGPNSPLTLVCVADERALQP